MTTYYKAVRPDGTDFFTGTVQWIPEDGIPTEGWLVEHPTERDHCISDASLYLSVATVPTDCTGMEWPCRLLRVEPAGRVGTPEPDQLPHKRCARAWRVVEELDPHLALGPQGREVAAIIDRTWQLSAEEAVRLKAASVARDAAWGTDAWDAAWDAALDAVLDSAELAAWNAARDAVWYAARGTEWFAPCSVAWRAARDAALAVLVRDLISDEHYQTLAEPWLAVVKEER